VAKANNDGNGGDDDAGGDSDEDPLDKYMAEVNKEVKKLKGVRPAAGVKKAAPVKAAIAPGGKKGVVIMMGVAKKKTEHPDKRGELIEQNQVSSFQVPFGLKSFFFHPEKFAQASI
jgi:hypothetical protein